MSSRRRNGRLRKGERTRLNNKYHKKSFFFLFLSEIFKPVFFLSSCNFHFIFANKHTFKLLLSSRKQTINSQASNTTNTFCFSLLAQKITIYIFNYPLKIILFFVITVVQQPEHFKLTSSFLFFNLQVNILRSTVRLSTRYRFLNGLRRHFFDNWKPKYRVVSQTNHCGVNVTFIDDFLIKGSVMIQMSLYHGQCHDTIITDSLALTNIKYKRLIFRHYLFTYSRYVQ